jgi:carbamoyl-phosphate synthase large subunit
MDTICVGVSGINAVDNPGPGIGVARSLREAADLKVKIVGLAYDALEPGIYMDWVVDKSFLLPFPSGSGEVYFDRLLEIRRNYGLDVVITNLDSELPFYIKYADRLAEHGIRTFLPSGAQFRLRSKDRLVELSEKIGLRVPKTAVISSPGMLEQAIREIGLPAMVKGCFYKAYRVNSAHEATARFNELVAEWGYPVILQQVVSGDELNVIGLGDGKGDSLGMVGIRKVWVTSLGKMWAGVTVKHARMLEVAKELVWTSCWRGPFELECIVSGDDVYLIEINPRFPAWVYAATAVGMNLPAQLLRACLGLPTLPVGDYQAGKLMIRYSYDMVTDIAPFHTLAARGEYP